MKFKVFIFFVFFVCSLLPGISIAQNKVVVVPLGGSKVDAKVDADGDGWYNDVDCDDTNPVAHPNAGWQRNSAEGNVGWDWNCSGGVEKKYVVYSDVAYPDKRPQTEAECTGILITIINPVECGQTINPASNEIRIIRWSWEHPESDVYFCDSDYAILFFSKPVVQECK